ncbi:MAG: AMP-binding protein, partial [Thermodesulfobacteriota bacterium]|nr:AMP-binding protein [Thermodesulfobacteriota bacterium]
NDIAIVSYTSGTTGAPKGVIMTFDYLFDTSFRVLMPHPFEPFTKYVSCMPPAWMTEQSFGFTWSLVVPFVIYFPEDPETILADIREVGAGFLAFGPRQYESFVSMCQARIEDAGRIRKGIYELGMKFAEWKSNRQKSNFFLKFLNLVFYLILFKKIADYLGLSKGKAALCGGSAMAPQVYSFFRRLGIDVRNTYGLSEVGLLCMHTGDDYNAETMGKWFVSHPKFGPPIEGKLAKNGELLVRGGSGFSGYYRNQEATEEATKDGWYYTGDVLTISEMGDLVYLDRLKDIKYLKGGQIFAPQFIETRLRFSPYIKDGIVVGDESRDYPVALINIDAEMTGKWAEKNNVVYSTFPDLSQNEKVINLIRNELKKINKLLGDQVKVKKFVNLTKELDPDEAELTRTRKLKRNVLEETYKNLINEIYADKPEYASIVPVKYRDGRVRNVEKKIIINDL